MPLQDDFRLVDANNNELPTWESDPNRLIDPAHPEYGPEEIPIPVGQRRAQFWRKMPAGYFNWLQKMCVYYGINKIFQHERERFAWTDILEDDIIYVPEGVNERPPQRGVINGQSGRILRKDSTKDEPVYCKARAKSPAGAVKLRLTASGSQPGDAVIAVGVSEKLSGPWTYFYGSTPWGFDPNQSIQEYDIETQALVVGKQYYYKIVRQRNDSGDTLNADVLLAGVQVR